MCVDADASMSRRTDRACACLSDRRRRAAEAKAAEEEAAEEEAAAEREELICLLTARVRPWYPPQIWRGRVNLGDADKCPSATPTHSLDQPARV